MSRLTSYTEDLGDEVCERIANGRSLKSICRDDDMPGETTVRRWLDENEKFRRQYTLAREDQIEHYADEIVDIADDIKNEIEPARVQAARLAIDTRKWIASKLKPKKYGDKIDVTANVTLEQLVMASLKPPASEDE